jgi:hypothetical protein
MKAVFYAEFNLIQVKDPPSPIAANFVIFFTLRNNDLLFCARIELFVENIIMAGFL